jgi:hypothetical protein
MGIYENPGQGITGVNDTSNIDRRYNDTGNNFLSVLTLILAAL